MIFLFAFAPSVPWRLYDSCNGNGGLPPGGVNLGLVSLKFLFVGTKGLDCFSTILILDILASNVKPLYITNLPKARIELARLCLSSLPRFTYQPTLHESASHISAFPAYDYLLAIFSRVYGLLANDLASFASILVLIFS